VSANLYDLLNVPETATADEIRAAWKDAIADLDPTAPRFRAFSDAAGVLLDEDRRAAYDAELAAERAAATEAEPDTEAEPEPDTEVATEPTEPVTEPTEPVTEPTEPTEPTGPATGPPGWALGAAAVAAVVAVALAVLLYLQPGGDLFSDDSPREIAERSELAVRDGLAAEAAAERMVEPVFSYDFQTMDADLERVTGYLTDRLAAKQTKLWPDLAENAREQELTVRATAEATALTRLSEDRDVATVVVFIRQDSVRRGDEKGTLRMWATLTLVRATGADHGWLLDDVCVDAGCA